MNVGSLALFVSGCVAAAMAVVLFQDGDGALGSRAMTTSRLGWMARGGVALVVVLGGAAPVAMAEVRQAEPHFARAAQRPASARAVVTLGRLHHVAKREIELGMLAQVAAVRPQTMAFATELEASFRALDRRGVVALAETLGIAEKSTASGVRR